jgi:ArsR family transcriptional regulator
MSEPRHLFKAEFFKALAHPTRIAILERLRAGEASVRELQDALGLDQSAVSHQLGVLRAREVVGARKEGATVRYRVRDTTLFELLDVARRIFNSRLTSTQALLRQLRAEEPWTGPARSGRGRARR